MRIKLNEEALSKLKLPEGKPQLVVWDTELTGFGVVIGKAARTFIAQGRVDGKLKRKAFGVAGQPRDDRHLWNVLLARQQAKIELGHMAQGVAPKPRATERSNGPTLRDALDAHVARMRKKHRAERSIATLTSELEKYMADWLERPISELTGAVLVKRHDEIKDNARARAGSNPQNAKGAPLANRVITQVGACWNSLNRQLEGKLGTWNPAKAVDRDELKPKRERIDDEGLPEWWAKVQQLSPVRRDLQIFCMFTAMRSEAARNVRWEHIDEKRHALEVPSPKGGESKAFTLPLGPTVMQLLKRRRKENAIEFKAFDGDQGFVFPSLSRDLQTVQPVAEPKEYRRTGTDDDGKVIKAKILPSLHVSRRTYLSIAAEVGVTELDRSVLCNHTYGKQSVNATYIAQSFKHLLSEQTKIDRALHARISPK